MRTPSSLQAKQLRVGDVSRRSSIDSGSASAGTPVNGTAAGGAGKMDYVYLKTILLQFLEQRDKKRQADLVKTVLGQLLHFDKYVPSSPSAFALSLVWGALANDLTGRTKRSG